MKKWLSILPLSLILLLCACQSSDASAQIFAMDTVMDLTVQGSGAAQALKDAEAELYRLDALLSRQDSASAVSALNESAGSPVAVEEELYNLLQTAVEYSTLTDGAFAVTVAPIMDAWDFTGEHPRVPSRAELDSLLPLVGDERIVFGSGTVTRTGWQNFLPPTAFHPPWSAWAATFMCAAPSATARSGAWP